MSCIVWLICISIVSVWELDYSSFLAPKVTVGSIWLVRQFLSADVIIQASCNMIAVLVVYGVYTCGFSLDRQLRLCPPALSELSHIYSRRQKNVSV